MRSNLSSALRRPHSALRIFGFLVDVEREGYGTSDPDMVGYKEHIIDR
jgi:hypothetical protein